jgi:predicted glycosyltransferase/glycosyltransferase involved in cell wall biosynthesis
MRILHVLDMALPHLSTGYAVRSNYILSNQKRIGLEPIVLTRYAHSACDNDGSSVEVQEGIPYLWGPSAESHFLSFKRIGPMASQDLYELALHSSQKRFRDRIADAVEEYAPDVIHVASPAANAEIAADVGRRKGVPVLYEVRGLWHDSAVANGRLDPASDSYRDRQKIFLKAMHDVDSVVTLAQTMKDEFVGQGVPASKIDLVPNGVDLVRFKDTREESSLKATLGLDPNDFVLGYIGSVRELEGLHLLIEAAAGLVSFGAPIRVVIAGNGPALDGLKRLATSFGIAHRVNFLGHIPHDQISAYYDVLDAVVIPRTRSKVTELVTPLKPLEAMAAAKPLIVSDVAALTEIVRHDETGLVFEAGDADDLWRMCARLMNSSELRTTLGEAGRRWVRSERGWLDLVARYVPIYEGLAVKKRFRRTSPQEPGDKRILFYSQHLIGVGHHFRNREIARALSKDNEVHVIDGGRPIPGTDLPDSVMHISLTPLQASASGLSPADSALSLNEALLLRQEELREAVDQIRPQVVIVEFFPFSRWSLRREIVEMILRVRAAFPDVKVVCSLRDIPTRAATADLHRPPMAEALTRTGMSRFYSVPGGGRREQDIGMSRRYYSEVVPTLNAYFDVVLVHGDAQLTRLEDHFPWVDDIDIPIEYTGYVSEKLKTENPPDDLPKLPYVLVSAGGGAEGFQLVAPCIDAWKNLHREGRISDHEMVIFTGAFTEDSDLSELRRRCANGPFRIKKFTNNFLGWMKGAQVSISRAGYNTCVNVLETNTRAVFVPSVAMGDQVFRAEKMQEMGIAISLNEDTLTPGRLEAALLQTLSGPLPGHNLSLDGAGNTARFVNALTQVRRCAA